MIGIIFRTPESLKNLKWDKIIIWNEANEFKQKVDLDERLNVDKMSNRPYDETTKDRKIIFFAICSNQF